ncbi:heterokaryon incompatibility protein-domain-containing protein [Xylaria cubensis]|nr:heterokaryon incompatibility protein-domain-containing protein [Xylaria cubensis]
MMAKSLRSFTLILESESLLRLNTISFLEQALPFRIGYNLQVPPTVFKLPNFNQRWKVVQDNTGSYIDNLGERVAVKRCYDDGSLSEVNDVHWAAHNLARFSIILVRDGLTNGPYLKPHSIEWQLQVNFLRRFWRENVGELAIQEMIQMKAQDDTRTTVIPTPNPYLYPALLRDPSAIRLIVLLSSAQNHGNIACRICNSTLGKSDIDNYEALSYVWGDPSKQKTISVDDKPFQATENLELALRNLRYRDKHRVLWIDSLCINQSDVTERSVLVQQMDVIYERAQTVIVWLGPESEDSSDAFVLLNQLDHKSVTLPAVPFTASAMITAIEHALGPFQDMSLYRFYFSNLLDHDRDELPRRSFFEKIMAVHHLLERPWFERVWCIQELILAKLVIVQCGQSTMSWEKLFYFSCCCLHPTIRHIVYCGIKEGIISRRQVSNVKLVAQKYALNYDEEIPGWQKVLRTLVSFRTWKSSDPRDKIFAFYGLIPHEVSDREALKPNYTLSTAEVYINTAIYIIRQSGNLDILSIATWPAEGFHDVSFLRLLPSWVTDWRDSQRFHLSGVYWPIAFLGAGIDIYSFDDMYRASLDLNATPVDLRGNLQLLALDGIDVDIIDDIGDTMLEYTNKALYKWGEIADLLGEYCYRYTGQSVHEAFLRTCLMDDQWGMNQKYVDKLVDQLMNNKGDLEVPARCRIPQQNIKLKWPSNFPPGPENDAEAVEAILKRPEAMRGRRFFKTAKGLFGLAPALAQKGDCVVVLFGGKVPFILRGFPDAESYHLVGESYVHGIMDGEAIHQPRIEQFQDLKVETFHIG